MAPSEDRKLIVLEARKEALFSRIQRLYDDSKNIDVNARLISFKIGFETLDENRKEFRQIISDIVDLSLTINPEYTPNFAPLDSFEDLYCHIKYTGKKVFSSDKTSQGTTPTQDSTPNKAIPMLPKLQLPTFTGEIQEWPIFCELFMSLIHNNTTLTDVDKVHYLIGSLSGKALQLCAGIPATGANYAIIWDSLVKKYEDKRLLVSCCLDKIFELKPIQFQTSDNLNNFLIEFDTAVKSLKKMNVADLADSIIAYLALKKLDRETCRLFENSHRNSALPTYADILEFVEEQAKICTRTSSDSKPNSLSSNSKQNSNSSKNLSFSSSGSKSKRTHSFVSLQNSSQGKVYNKIKCPICNNSHNLISCSRFIGAIPTERYQIVKNKNLCLNCLGTHKIVNCTSQVNCKSCGLRHHSMLHFDKNVSNSTQISDRANSSSAVNIISEPSSNMASNCNSINKASDSVNTSNTLLAQLHPSSSQDFSAKGLCSTSVNNSGSSYSTILLGTALVQITDNFGKTHSARFLLDSASQRHIITSSFCKRTNLSISKISSIIQGIGNSSNPVVGQVNLVVSSHLNPIYRYPIVALVVENIIDKLPYTKIDINAISHISRLPLADNTFHRPGEIDGIIGAELYSHLLGTRHIIDSPNLPTAVETTLGYIIMGPAPTVSDANKFNSLCTIVDTSLNELVQRFWELEQVPLQSVQAPEDVECEENFRTTYKRLSSGRYVVSLPFKLSPSHLGDSYTVALRRFHSLERKFRQNLQYKAQYVEIIKQYLEKGYLKKVVVDSKILESAYYIPHHGILKVDSISTPLRIVMDAGAKTDSSYSLNEILHRGPKLQADVLTLLLNFRLYKIALTADVRKMYLQIQICEEHQRFQRILWRYSEEEEVSVYELTTVTFGVKSSPYLALRTVKQLAEDEGSSYPLASSIALKQMYMDDLLISVPSLSKAKIVYEQMLSLFRSGGFDLVKWAVNSKQLLEIIPEKLRSPEVYSFETDMLKVLGLQWQPNTDFLSFNFNIVSRSCTKRNILSTVAHIFDPCGFLAPVSLKLKLFIKQLWTFKIDWDELPPESFVQQWTQFEKELPLLRSFKVPRHLGILTDSSVVLIGFCDACESSYGAMVYIRACTKGQISTNLVCAKTKVSPLKTLSIPRLELSSAYLLSKLINFIAETFQPHLLFDRIFALSDSTVALSWIRSSPHRWKVFVANRVTKIQELIPNSCWYHVSGIDNIADCLSRGLLPAQLLANQNWIRGPDWLMLEQSQWPIKSLNDELSTSLEEKMVSLVATDTDPVYHPLYLLISRCSSWLKLLRVTVYVCRFVKKLPHRRVITVSDLDFAENILLKIVQDVHFADEIQSLKKDGSCSSRIRKLRPFLRGNLLRVGGRLVNSSLNFNSQHPVLLPKKEILVDLLIYHYHKIHLHTGPSLVLSLLRQRYWILAGRGVVRNIISKCNFCFKVAPKIQYPLMGDLPACRVQQAKPFLHTGVDFAGPLYIVFSRRRGTHSQKAYICLFVCLVTKAVHIELVSDLSTAKFIQAFKRFLSRRGPCNVIWSDRGSNFIGSKSVLKEIYDLIASEEFELQITSELVPRGIEWKYTPGQAPHFGGLWESNIRSVKTHLRKIVGNQLLSYEEMYTFLVQIEALLNSRPLSLLPSDPSESIPLTPAHFLTLTPLERLPAVDYSGEKLNRLDRYQLIDRMVRDFWKRWHIEYLHTLQTREKWNTEANSIKVGTVVLLQQPNTPPLQWPLGRIVEVFPGRDGKIRVVSVKTKTGVYNRPVVKVCPLPTQ